MLVFLYHLSYLSPHTTKILWHAATVVNFFVVSQVSQNFASAAFATPGHRCWYCYFPSPTSVPTYPPFSGMSKVSKISASHRRILRLWRLQRQVTDVGIVLSSVVLDSPHTQNSLTWPKRRRILGCVAQFCICGICDAKSQMSVLLCPQS